MPGVRGIGKTDHRSGLTEHRSINAVAESFFATLKREMDNADDLESRASATMSISEYIDGFYNPTRRHSTLNYVSPIEFELLQSVKKAA